MLLFVRNSTFASSLNANTKINDNIVKGALFDITCYFTDAYFGSTRRYYFWREKIFSRPRQHFRSPKSTPDIKVRIVLKLTRVTTHSKKYSVYKPFLRYIILSLREKKGFRRIYILFCAYMEFSLRRQSSDFG